MARKYEKVPEACCARLRDLRCEQHLSQRELALRIGMKQRNYSDIESGIRSISVSKLILLADLYGVSMDYISGVSDERE